MTDSFNHSANISQIYLIYKKSEENFKKNYFRQEGGGGGGGGGEDSGDDTPEFFDDNDEDEKEEEAQRLRQTGRKRRRSSGAQEQDQTQEVKEDQGVSLWRVKPQFVASVLVSIMVLSFCFFKLGTQGANPAECSESNMYFSLISSIIAWYVPTPTWRANNGTTPAVTATATASASPSPSIH